MDIILASASPRREALLKLVVKSFSIFAPEVDETLPENIAPAQAVVYLAEKKLSAAQEIKGKAPLIITADTVVAAAGKILGKPACADEARYMLKALSGAAHEVFTGVAVACAGRRESFFERSQVTFKPLDERIIEAYILSNEWQGKAGGYGIQGPASVFVAGIQGDYFNIVGLPVARLYVCLADLAPELLIL